MIERKIIKDKLTEFLVEEYISSSLDKVGFSGSALHKTPLGEKIIIKAARPGLIVGAKGSNIKRMTKALKTKFNLDNPQIEIEEVKDQSTNARLVAEYIASSLERFGSSGFKGVGYRVMDDALKSGALGIEVLISGKIPSSRARTWRFYMGYLKKCGDVALSGVNTAYTHAKLKTGVVGIQVRIMPPGIELPDRVVLKKDLIVEEQVIEQAQEGKEATEEKENTQEKDAKAAPKKAPAKKAPAKKAPAKKAAPKKAPAKKKTTEKSE